MAKTVVLLRHTDNDGDVLTADGVRAALAVGAGLEGPFDVVVSSGAQRATQCAACVLAGAGVRVRGGVVVDHGFRSEREDDWRDAYRRTEHGRLEEYLAVARELVESDAARFADAVRRTAALLDDDRRALVVGHSPMHEAAVWAVTGSFAPPLAKGSALTIVAAGGAFAFEAG